MSKFLSTLTAHAFQRVVAAGNAALWTVHRAWHTLRHRDDRIPIEILLADRSQRHRIECQVRAGLRQLHRVLRAPVPADIAVVVQQVITTERQLAGCYQMGQRSDGVPYALLRLALEVNGRRLSSDELLAALAEQVIGLVTQRNGDSVLVPVDFEPVQPNPVSRHPSLRPDPLMPSADGGHPHRA